MNIKEPGTGSSKCKILERPTHVSVTESGFDASIEEVEDIRKIMVYGVKTTPQLIECGTLNLRGKLPSMKELNSFIA